MSTSGAVQEEPLVIEAARKRFGTVQALDGVSFVVGAGELVGLLGPNGAGKTTLIQAVAGRLALDGGTVRLFGRLLASLCRSRAQLAGISTIVILTMSAVGGSMFPRFLMSETMQQFGLITFNARALDGYIKVFWRDTPLYELWPQVLVLVGLTTVFLTLARRFARRWELG